MAKGDDARARNQIEYQGNLAQNHLNNTREMINPMWQEMRNNYTNATARDTADRAGIMGQFQGLMPRYQEFADTGGYSPEDIASIRARAISPTRAAYANARREVDRGAALTGGYQPGRGALMARMAREQGQALSDANTNVEAALAQMRQQGRLAGLSGMGDTARSMTSLYGTTPAMSATFGNQVLGASGQALDLQGLQNQLGLGIMGNQIEAGRMPGKWEHNINRLKDIGGIYTGVMGGGE